MHTQTSFAKPAANDFVLAVTLSMTVVFLSLFTWASDYNFFWPVAICLVGTFAALPTLRSWRHKIGIGALCQRTFKSLIGCFTALSVSLLFLGFLLQQEFHAAPVLQEFAAKDFDRYAADKVSVVGSIVRQEKSDVVGSTMIYASVLNFHRINENLARIDQARELIGNISMSDEPRLLAERAAQMQKDELRSMQIPYEVYLRAQVVSQFISQAGHANTAEEILNGSSTQFDRFIASRDELENYNKKLMANYPLWSWLLTRSGAISA